MKTNSAEMIIAAVLIVDSQRGSSSLLQKKMKIGYNLACQLMDELENHGIIGEFRGSESRNIHIKSIDALLAKLKENKDQC